LLKLNFAKIYFFQKIILKKIEIWLKNNIIIYNLFNKVAKYIKIINCYLRIWKNIDNTIDLSFEKYIEISIVTNWQTIVNAKLIYKVYLLS